MDEDGHYDDLYSPENDDFSATMSFEHSDLELADETVVEESDEPPDEEDARNLDRSQSLADEDVEIDGYKAISAGEKTPWRTEDAAELMFGLAKEKSEKLLKTVPYKVQRNCTFVISLAALKSDADVLADSNGGWQGLRGKREADYDYDEDSRRVSTMVDGEGSKFIRHCYHNLKVKDYKRVVVSCTDLRMAFVQYYFKNGPERSFEVEPHKNSKKKITYERLQDSTRRRINELAGQGKKPREIHEQILKDVGGVSGVQTTAAIPSIKAIYNHIASNKTAGFDDFHALILRCIREAGTSAEFIRQVCVAPSFMVMLANERQLDDFVRFSAVDGFSLDTTFNVGDYLVTTAVCRHMLLLRKSTEVHPVIVGPSFIHKYKNTETFRWMASQLVNARPNVRKARYFGTDGDAAMYVPFKQILPDSWHLLCMIHFKDNMARKAAEWGMTEFLNLIMDSILGRRDGTERHSGFIDCKTDEEYAKAEEEICEMICGLHTNGHKVAEYFRIHKAPQLREHYSVQAQEAAGLLGKLYNTNAVESINALLKKDVIKKRTPLQFAEDVEALAEKQRTGFEFAVIGKGEFVLTPQYKHLEVSFKRYSGMSSEQKAAAIKKFHTEAYDPNREIPDVVELQDARSLLVRNEHGKKLAEIEFVNPDVLLGMLDSAEKILQIETPVSNAPGPYRSRFLVAKQNSFVEVLLNEVTMECKCSKECQCFTLYGFCPDIIAAAIHLHRLDVLVSWANSDKVRKSNKFGLYHLTKANAPAKVGQKPRGTAIRKGSTHRPDAISGVLPTQSWPVPSGNQAKRSRDVMEGVQEESREAQAIEPVPYSPALHKTALWNKIAVQTLGQKPQPDMAEYEIWFLDQVDARTTKCSGCERNFCKSKDALPTPPNDAVFVTCGKRKFWKKGEQEVAPKPGNMYFHLQKVCLNDGFEKMEITKAANSKFVTSGVVKARLTVEHESRLWAALF